LIAEKARRIGARRSRFGAPCRRGIDSLVEGARLVVDDKGVPYEYGIELTDLEEPYERNAGLGKYISSWCATGVVVGMISTPNFIWASSEDAGPIGSISSMSTTEFDFIGRLLIVVNIGPVMTVLATIVNC